MTDSAPRHPDASADTSTDTSADTAPAAHSAHSTAADTSADSAAVDIVVFGATGFVGSLVAAYLARREQAGDGGPTTVALAGRNRDRLARTRSDLPGSPDWPLITADSTDVDSLRAMARRARVVITTVGPYTRYGEDLVRVCAEEGTDYVDLTGEVLFAHRSAERNDATARDTGARIVHSCGFDSVPSDIGMFVLHRAVEEAGAGPLVAVDMVVRSMKGGFSGGTVDSLRAQSEEERASRDAARLVTDPYALSPDRAAEPDLGPEPDLTVASLEPTGGTGWGGPFFMAPYNTRVVRRSNALTGHAYGPRLRYREVIATGSSPVGRLKALVLSVGTKLGFAALTTPALRRPLSVVVPDPGEGPDEASRESGHFHTHHQGVTHDGSFFHADVAAQGDPGYVATAIMLSEAALTLVHAGGRLPGDGGGVLTPATGLGAPYVERLRAAGVTVTAGPGRAPQAR
ncbi:saccharopine dehydrogenase family protein [Corynebacterium bovis]|uniref:saccharopine dehydrogenase family protein n=1 Tax=Corynebacterium bovis TaxID=36808 RepID=UPI0021AB932B|nr:saccharopine dehydrogenase NADP-binding domain-containing protein [Corynebacterium bovis]MDN8579826.1 saccharopine dehydrogenase NADP-binding domain-containing protein [Corynebacterium bovis]